MTQILFFTEAFFHIVFNGIFVNSITDALLLHIYS
ncbi:hypothetical protein Xenpb_01126 [Xenorhabdus sp. PB62.4]|nr:hypothetical protein [Xenorhabdus sp. PB62.4]